jgi:hypothetical protein
VNVSLQRTAPVLAGALAGLLAGCGTVGMPIPPENVGVNTIILQQQKQEMLELKRREAAAAGESVELLQDPALQGQDVILPPLRPVGTR